VLTVGAFDGVHLGHQAVLQQLIDKGKELGLPTLVVLFEPLPREYFSPKLAPARVMSFREKFRALKKLGIDRVLRIHFTATFSEMDATTFIRKVLVQGLGVRYVIVGDDLRFGYNREGSFELLQEEGKKSGFEVVSTSTLVIKNKRVSSTRIRQALQAANFDLATELLGRPFSITGRVIVGQQLGRQLGTPTANLELHRLSAPLSGVYAVDVIVAERHVKGVANIGTRPTVEDRSKAILEVHLLDFNQDIYGKVIEVFFLKKIREEKKFASLDLLKQHIHQDIQAVRDYFATIQ